MMQIYRTENNIFPDELLDQFNQELSTQVYKPYLDGWRYEIKIINGSPFTFCPVTFSKGKLLRWIELKNKVVENETIRKAIEVALEYFGKERNLDGEERFAVNLLCYRLTADKKVSEGEWHSDYATDWTMITMLSDPNQWEGGSLKFSFEEDPELMLANDENYDLLPKTEYIKNRAIFFKNFNDNPVKTLNYHTFDAMKSSTDVDRVILTLFQFDKTYVSDGIEKRFIDNLLCKDASIQN